MKKIQSIVALCFIIIITGSGACEKDKKGQVMFYSDAFYAINCIVDSVSVYIDDVYVGKVIRNTDGNKDLFTEQISPALQYSQKAFIKELPTGKYNYHAKMHGCVRGDWKGSFEITKNKTTEVYLEVTDTIK